MAWWLHSAYDPFEPPIKQDTLCILFKTFLARSQWKAAKLYLSSPSSLRPKKTFLWNLTLESFIQIYRETSSGYISQLWTNNIKNQLLLRTCEIYFQKMWRRKIKHKLYAQPQTHTFSNYTGFTMVYASIWPSRVQQHLLTLINVLYTFHSVVQFMIQHEICKYGTMNDNHQESAKFIMIQNPSCFLLLQTLDVF
jgi:hypothetical protein